uniref:recombinase family protein n=1 Tax=uncultured Oscillibacter sp. TaxID=876091 RepID=UPI0025FFB847
MKQPIYNTALYLRLSRDDEQQGDSGSIQTQRMMLRDYAQTHGLNEVSEYVDDGWSGTNYDRLGFQKMIDDIEDGKINCVVTKDLSRLGRNYIMTGQYTEIYFPSKGVRYIAVNDNVDTLNGESELAPFLNILNEMHARQTSKKVKAALKARRMNGAHISSFAPLGYWWDLEQKGHLLVDPETKWIVEKIIDMAVHGMGAAKIMKALIREKVPTPGYIHYVREGAYAHIHQNAPEKARYAWNEAKIRLVLTDENYLGNSVHNKTSVKSFKLKKQTRNPTSEWVRVEGTHEAIVSRDVFDQVQKQIVSRRRQRRDDTTQIFAGLVKCADCGWMMHFARQNKGNHGNLPLQYQNHIPRQGQVR